MIYTNYYNLPKSLTDVIDNITYDITLNDPNRFSATSLIQTPRIRQLTIRHWNEIEDDYSNHIWQITGNAFHYILAKTKKENRQIEQKIEIKLDDYLIVNKPDLYDEETKTIEDWKVTSVFAVKSVKKDWEQQLNCYDWSLEKIGFKPEKMVINAILRDWSETEFKRYKKDYPPIPFKQIEIPIWTFEQQNQFILDRISIHKIAEKLNDKELPLCSPEERWATEEKWAVYKNKNIRATKLLDSETKAKRYTNKCNKNVKNDKFYYKKREGLDLRCIKYCTCNHFCSYYLSKYSHNEKTT